MSDNDDLVVVEKQFNEFFRAGEDIEEIDEEEIARRQRSEYILELAKNWQPFTSTDTYKCPDAGYYGGFAYNDPVISKKLRGAASEMLKMIGKRLLAGGADLTKISFPIKCMCPTSQLALMPTLQSTMTVYINKAAMIEDRVERMRLLITQ